MSETQSSLADSTSDSSSSSSNSPLCSNHVCFCWTGTGGYGRYSKPVESVVAPPACDSLGGSHTTHLQTGAARVRFTYRDEETRARICKNAQALVDGLQRDRSSMAVNAQVARKALHYRRLMDRFCDLDPDEPNVDISAFLGIEWHHVEAQGSPESPVSSETSSSSSSMLNEDDEGRVEKGRARNDFRLEL